MLARCQSIINEFIGEMVSYEAEAGGRLFQDMVPNKKLMETQTSLGSKTELELHTEQASLELRPDFLSLACLKGDKNAKRLIIYTLTCVDNK
jgi:L-asparagine oxygenase